MTGGEHRAGLRHLPPAVVGVRLGGAGTRCAFTINVEEGAANRPQSASYCPLTEPPKRCRPSKRHRPRGRSPRNDSAGVVVGEPEHRTELS